MACLDIYHDKLSMAKLGATPTDRPNIPTPELAVEFIEVKGRDGALTKQGDFLDVSFPIKYNVLERTNIKPLIRKIKGFIYGSKTLSFSDDIIFYKIKSMNLRETENEIEEYGLFTIDYVCDPFQYVKSTRLTKIENNKVFNFGTYKSLPKIKLIGNGKGQLKVNGEILEVLRLEDELILDSELGMAYKIRKNEILNRNNNIRGKIPELEVGNNTVEFNGGIVEVWIDGRWRYI